MGNRGEPPGNNLVRGEAPRLILLMGVAGSGKTTLGKLLAESLGYTFLDADDFHSNEAIARMRSGAPLTDSMRDAWIERLERALMQCFREHANCVLAYSGLRARHRRRLMNLGFATSAFMLEGSDALLTQRLGQRTNHFMPAAQLQDQLESMEAIEADEGITPVDIGALPSDIVAALAARLKR
jgi:gluconokinase